MNRPWPGFTIAATATEGRGHSAVLGAGLSLLAACGGGGDATPRAPTAEPGAAPVGCYAVEQPARRVTLCLGAPRLPSGRYVLYDSETVPGATFMRQCDGRYSSDGGAVRLTAESCSGHTFEEQRELAGATEPRTVPSVRVRILGPASLAIVIEQAPELVLRRTE
ncbi:MAG: hypothetical protein OZ921_18430 [Sorangiineae bacterium]|nr:hypothetical protein [Polyangiaceae bacterium]MEB2324498.1 hypothetical protein [Sorangiineae bacterium]